MTKVTLSPISSRMKRDSLRNWLSGLAITLTTIVSYFAFWTLSPGVTFLIGGAALVTLLVLLWKAG